VDAAHDCGKTQKDVAEALGISERTLGRRRNDGPGFSVNELTRAAGILGFSMGPVLETALEKFGGMGRLLSEVRHNNDVPESLPIQGDVADPFDNVTTLSRKESREVDTERQAAHRRKKDQGE
jgi:transcriptional regulator with XRE-family HTH domain